MHDIRHEILIGAPADTVFRAITTQEGLIKKMSILPEGEQLRKAIKWMSDIRLDNPGIGLSRLIGDASLKFDLPPKDAEFLLRFFTEKGTGESDINSGQ